MDITIARRALKGALTVRAKAGVDKSDPLCVYDLHSKLKVDMRFQAGASFGGMYAKETQTILIPSERPVGRRAYTCAHELGHWHFHHGTKLEDMAEMEKGGSDDPDEILANQFAAELLMSKWAVEKALKERNLTSALITPQNLYALSCQFGVGYETVITHLRFGLGFFTKSQATSLSENTPKMIKQNLLGEVFPGHLILVDSCWRSVPIDLEIGDAAMLMFDFDFEGSGIERLSTPKGEIISAMKPGIFRVRARQSNWTSFLRVSRKGFTGRAIYRHLEDPDV